MSALNVSELKLVAEILMGAAFVDGEFDGSEKGVIKAILADLVGADNFPGEVGSHLDHFVAEKFNLEEACSKLHLATAEDRRTLLALISEVTDADEVHDMEEDAYIKRVARCIGADPSEYADLTVELLSISSLSVPPPLPPGADA